MADISAMVERQLAYLSDGWRLLGNSPAEIADLIEFNRPRLIERAQFKLPGARSTWLGRVPINEHSTLNHAQQFGRLS